MTERGNHLTPDAVAAEAPRLETAEGIFEAPELGAGDPKGYFTAVFDVGQSRPDFRGRKSDVPVVRLEYMPPQKDTPWQVVVKVEDGHESYAVTLYVRDSFDERALEQLAKGIHDFVTQYKSQEVRGRLANIFGEMTRKVCNPFASAMQSKRGEIRPYLPYDSEGPTNDHNLKDAQWLAEHFKEQKDVDVDQRGERILRATIGSKEFEFLQSGDMYFVLNNVPTIEVMDAAISEGIMTEKEKGDFVSLEEEAKLKKQTVEQYQQKGVKRGAEKDLRDIWQNSGANYEYDAARRLYYLEIAGEPVMDEFERDYIELLGTNAARYDHAVLEIGFGMGIAGNAIQKELVRQGDLALQEGREANPTHIIIEFNHAVAEKAREWAKRQKIPVVVLEGDWKEKIKEIPKGILTGALADPYPLNLEEKHKDAAMTLQEIHERLRPGGVASIYADSQYALSPDHAAIAKEAGYKYIGTVTTRFAKGGKNTGEYYNPRLRMAMPVFYKDGGTGSANRQAIELNDNGKRKLVEKLFIDNPRHFREKYFGVA